jgi:barstar (barnase inhibitor)
MNASDLLNPSAPWVAKYVADYDSLDRLLWSLRSDSRGGKMMSVALRGRKMKERQGVFDEFGVALQFPYYFGENWNAFIDCIGDLGWLVCDGFVIVVRDACETLTDGDPDEFGLLIERLDDAGESWSKSTFFRGPKPFHVLLHASPDQVAQLDARLAPLTMQMTEFEENHSMGDGARPNRR